jgi:hypothetical protein
MPQRILIPLLAILALCLPAALSAQVLRVTVTDPSGGGVADALVRIERPDGTLVRAAFSENDGGVAAQVPRGAYLLRVGRSGYAPSALPVQVGEGENRVRVRLSERALGLDTLVVITPRENERGRDAFLRRRQMENGVFLDPGYFLDRYDSARWIGDLLRDTPGLNLVRTPRTGRIVVQNARQWNCFNVLLNGVRYLGSGPMDRWVRPNEIIAVEIYHVGSDVPREYSRFSWEETDGADARPCGVIIYWTRQSW